MRTEQPHIAARADGLRRKVRRLVGRIGFRIDKVTQKAVDLGGLKAGERNVEPGLLKERSQTI